jgi:hypothetical protein
VLETEDLLEEMEALVESMERVRDGRYIAEAIVFGVVGSTGGLVWVWEMCCLCVWRLDGRVFGRWMFGL